MTFIQELASQILKQAESLGVSYADVRASSQNSTSFLLHNNEFDSMVSGEVFGIGVRVIHKGKIGFYSTNNKSKIADALNIALKLAKANPGKDKVELAYQKPIKKEYTITAKKPLNNISVDQKVELARQMTKAAQRDLIKSIDVRYADSCGDSIFASSEGTELLKHAGRTVVVANIVAKQGDRLEQVHSRYGGCGFEKYDNAAEHFKGKAKLAIDLLKARLPKAGTFDAVLDSEAAGVFAHEAVGHACEADAILSNASILKGKLSETIGSKHVDISDAPTIDDEWGSYQYDDEGTPAQHTKLIVNGVLKEYLHSRSTAAKMGVKSTGNARAQSYAFAPIVRMSNTFFEGGNFSVDELIKEIKNGYLLIDFSGGTVEPLAGDFTFACECAREIKNGKLGALLNGCTFGGKILETMHDIFGGSKFNKKMGIGWCGKGGQSVPAGDGACHIGIRKLHIGGRA